MRVSQFLADRLGALAAGARAQIEPVLAGEAEALHDFRVHLRRLRSVLRPLSGTVYDAFYVKTIRRELGAIASGTNELRDQEALRESLTPLLEPELANGPNAAPPEARPSIAPASSPLASENLTAGASMTDAAASNLTAEETITNPFGARNLEEEGLGASSAEHAGPEAAAAKPDAAPFEAEAVSPDAGPPPVPGLAAFLEREAKREAELRTAFIEELRLRRDAWELPLRQTEALCILPVRGKRDVAVERFALDLAEPLRDIVERKLARLQADPRVETPWLHDLRLDCKRLRYVVNFYQDALPPLFQESAKLARKLQNRLGTLNDYANIEACVAGRPDVPAEFRAALQARLNYERGRVERKLRDRIAKTPV